MKRIHWVLILVAWFIFLIANPSHLGDLFFKEFGPIWLLLLYPIALYLVYRTGKKVWKVWRIPSEEVTFASFPKNLQQNPIKCHRCFVAVLVGLTCLIWSAFVIPLWVRPSNEIVRIESQPFSSPPAWAPLIDGIMVSTMVTLWLGFLILGVAYASAAFAARRLAHIDKKDAEQAVNG
ncbi:MAG: hypothetical protein H6752_07265 [Candidatus Omnitrophica bacterium]|nr:hypothetical protein [Candidatus Omnitrophota bacterium]